MADETLTAKGIGASSAYGPDAWCQEFDGDDDDNHDITFDGRRQSALSIGADNPCDQILTVAVYGSYVKDAAIGDTGVFSIGSFTVAAADKDYETVADRFPWYIARCSLAAAPGTSLTVTVYAAFVSA